jgi:homoserine dehydrogenase
MLAIAIAGLGTVGSALVRQLRQNADLIAVRAGQAVEIKAVSARHKSRKRDCDLSGIKWIDDPVGLASLSGIDVVVELIGGADGPALQLAEAALSSGKHLVTANKALIAKHGPALAKLAEKYKVQLSFEAAVAGGIPVIKTLREGFAGDKIDSVSGILNGTCNYILTRMRTEKLPFATVLADAQKQGYAEADPAADIDGPDTANKLAILTSLAFGVKPDLSSIRVSGIRNITLSDLQFAEELGYRIKLLGVARQTPEGIEQSVEPTLVSESSPLASVDGTLNCILLRGRRVGPVTLVGRGAGGEPTANAVTADIMDIARGGRSYAFSLPAKQLQVLKQGKTQPKRYYMRLQVQDRPGVVADIAGIMRDEALSFESLIQRGRSSLDSVPVVITTHAGNVEAMRRAAKKIAKVPTITEYPCLIPMEDA